MEQYSKKLRAYLDQNPMRYTDGDSLLEELYWCYGEANAFDSPELRNQFQQFYQSMPELTADRFDEIFCLVSSLTVQQEKIAFQAGVRTGFGLAAELLE